MVYLVRSLGFEPETFHLTTGTFNLVVKDRIAFRLSGAPSVQADSETSANARIYDESDCPRNLFKLLVPPPAVNPLCPQDFHLLCTIWGRVARTLLSAF